MDTLNLARNVTALDIEMLGYLFPYCDPDTLADLERNNMEFTDLKAYGAAIENIELYDKVGISYVPFTCPAALVAILSDFILALVEVEVAIVASFREDGIKLSVRSEDPEVHAGNAQHFNIQGRHIPRKVQRIHFEPIEQRRSHIPARRDTRQGIIFCNQRGARAGHADVLILVLYRNKRRMVVDAGNLIANKIRHVPRVLLKRPGGTAPFCRRQIGGHCPGIGIFIIILDGPDLQKPTRKVCISNEQIE